MDQLSLPHIPEPPEPSASYLPLPPGGRPALGGRAWLERLHLHAQARLPGRGLSVLTGLSAGWTLRAAAQSLRQSELDPHVLIQGWADLPLLLSPAFAQRWEHAKPWMRLRLPIYMTASYQALLDSPRPSDAYCPSTSTECREVWRAFLASEPAGDLCPHLDLSADLWMGWALDHPRLESFRTTTLQPLQALGRALGLTEVQANLWSRLELWWLGLGSDFPTIAAHLLSTCSDNAQHWFHICAAAVEISVEEVSDLFAPNSTLVRRGLYHPLVASGQSLALPGNERGFSDRMGSWATSGWDTARAGLATTGQPAWNKAVSGWSAKPPAPAEVATIARAWSHLDGAFEQALAALIAKPAIRMLIVGDSGVGKTRFLRDLALAAQLHPLTLAPVNTTMISPDSVLVSLRQANWACASKERSVLLVDHQEEVFERESAARAMKEGATRPWLVAVSNLKRFHAQARDRFDKIIWLDAMPLARRLELAGEHFKDEGLALRVARALRTPRAIIEAANWCRMAESWTWATVQSHCRNADRAAANTGYDNGGLFEIEAPIALEALPPMAGNAHLSELSNRLALSFEKPSAFSELGATAPKGAVLLGPPGTGKTLFTRHLAARLQAPLIAPDPSTLAKHPDRIALLFEFARRHAPCVVLLDEAEPLICLHPFLPPPPALAALLTEIDGVEQLEGVMVIATTNNPNIAPPLLRSGRLSEVRSLDVPFQEDREQIWAAYLKGRPLAAADTAEPLPVVLARASRGLTGADIADTLRRAAGEAVAAGEKALSLPRLLRACDDVRWAAADGRDSVCPKERRSVAIHEAGHALLAWRWGLDVQRITVRSRSGALGMVQWDHIERRHEQSRSKAFGRLQMTLGGIAAEQAFEGEYGAGGSSDLKSAKQQLLGALAFNGLGQLGPVSAGKPEYWSDQLRRQIESECHAWSTAAFEEAVLWLTTHQTLVDRLADALLAAGDLSGPDLLEYAAAVDALPVDRPKPPAVCRVDGEIADARAAGLPHPDPALEEGHRLHRDPGPHKAKD